MTKYLTYKDINGKQTPMSMEVEVIDIYKGQETRKTVTVWGDNGMLCRPYLSQFETTKYYVIAFYKCSDGGHQNPKDTDYSISNCGDYWLNADMKSQYATGVVGEKKKEILLATLKEKLKTK
ncbi:MAG: hypothetical protein HY063_01445 [Bacteroidetes bacterium]|nr:hypothetical protein [Bacteroidota bacterium]